MTSGIHDSLQDSCPVPGRGAGIRLHRPNHRQPRGAVRPRAQRLPMNTHQIQTGEIPAFAGMTVVDCGNDGGGLRE